MRIPLSAPDIDESDVAAVEGVLRSGRLSLGPKAAQLERAIADSIDCAHAVAVSSGTAGLHLCMRALGIGDGDEVIVPSFTFIAVANAVRYESAVPVFADVDPATLNLDPARVEEAVTSRTRAIVVVHTFGCPAALDEIKGIARRHGLHVVEDACEALGAEYRGRRVGPLGDAGVFAFYPNKQITTGEGGIVVTSKPELARRMRGLRNQGRNGEAWYEHTELGYNYRLSEMSSALGVSQLRRLDAILERRRQIAHAYQRRLTGHPDLVLPLMEIQDGRISWFVYVLRLGEDFTQQQRDWIAREMNRRGIGCGRYFAPIHLQPAYRSHGLDLPVTERCAVRTLALPFFNRIAEAEIDEVCTTLLDLIRQSRSLSG